MSKSKITMRYAHVLLEHAIEKKAIDTVYADMLLFREIGTTHSRLLEILINPVVSIKDKKKLLQTIFRDQFNPITLFFFNLITEQHQAQILFDLANNFLKQYEVYKGIARGRISTAMPLSTVELARFEAMVYQIEPCKKVILTQHVDASLIGGYLLEVNNQKIDKTLKKELQLLHAHYMNGTNK